MKTALKVLVSVGVVAVVAAIVMAQDGSAGAPPKPKVGADSIKFKATLGSFKLLGSGVDPVRGKLNVGFRGTILLTDPQGDMRWEGDVRKEYEDKEHKKVAYFGKGRLIFDGAVHNIQMFGGDIDGEFKGFCMLRLSGEFDKTYNTGTYQYAGDVERPWGTGGMNLPVPQMIYDSTQTVTPKVQDTP